MPLSQPIGTVAVSERTGRVYVTQEDFVAVFDGETHAPLAPLFFGLNVVIGDVAVHPTNGRVYVSLLNQNIVAVVDEITGQTITKIPVQSRPLRMAFDPPANRLYVAHQDSPVLSTINTLTNTPELPKIGPDRLTFPELSTSAGLAVDVQGRIYHRVTLVQSGLSKLFLLFRDDLPEIIRGVRDFTSASGQVAFNPSNGIGYLALAEEGLLQPVSEDSRSLLFFPPTRVPFPKPLGLAIDPTAARLYITDFGGEHVGIYDVSGDNATAPKLVDQVAVGAFPRAIAVNSRTHRAYAVYTTPQSIAVIRDSSFTLPRPVVTAVPTIASGEWTNQDVTLSLTFGPGLVVGPRELVFQMLGANEIPRSTSGFAPLTIRFSPEGSSNLFYAARASDNLSSDPNPAIRLSPPGLFQVKIDKTPPVVTLGTVDQKRWFGGGEPVVSGAATDALSGLLDPGNDATFSLRAAGREGAEIADGATDSRTIRDLAGNSVTAGPITGLRIDRKAPALTVRSPADAASFLLNQKVVARFSAKDGGSGLQSTESTVPSGARLLTGQVGVQSFLLGALDKVGNIARIRRSYTVRYRVRRLDSGSFKIPGNLAWKLQLQDAAKKNQSASTIPVLALRIEPVAGGPAFPLNQPFIFNPTLGGKGGGYELALSFASLPKGAHRLIFTADGVEHESRFTVR
jgi:YVTN family beta-propeller protein